MGFARLWHDWPARGHGPSRPGFFLRASASVFQLNFCIGFSAPVIQLPCGLIAAPRAADGEARSVASVPFGRTSWRPRQRKLFTPLQIGPTTLQHRVLMAPLTRSRSEQPCDIPGNLMVEYYSQRASDGGLIISEATTISIAGRRWYGAPGMHSDEQVAGWKKVVNAVHAKGGRMFSQLWHTGRSAHVDLRNGATSASSSPRSESKNNDR